MRKSSMLQRQLRLNANAINMEEGFLEDAVSDLLHYKGMCSEGGIARSRKRIVESKRKRRQLAELQVFLKRELQQAYVIEQIEERWHDVKVLEFLKPMGEDYKHVPQFMAECPPAELGSFVEDEQ